MPRTTVSASDAAAVGLALREARLRRGLSQTALAARLQVSPGYVSRIEAGKGNTTVGALARFATALDAKMHVTFELNDRTGPPTSALNLERV